MMFQFDRPFHRLSASPRGMFVIYQLETPLAPGDKLNMTFKSAINRTGFRDGNELPEFAYNGTFFDAAYVPYIGYDNGVELDDPRRRREEGLGLLTDAPPRGDPYGSVTNGFTANSDWVSFKTTISTPDDQIALRQYLQRDWHGKRPSLLQLRHGRRPDRGLLQLHLRPLHGEEGELQGINIEVYYDYHHPWDVDDMMDGVRAGLDYYQANFSPFQYKQFRIIEYPRYRNFAQSFSNTSPFTETFFLSRVLDPKKDIDFTFFVTAHELAHQWWGHQLIGGRVAVPI